MGIHQLVANKSLRVALLVGSCFLLASTGWLAWLYRLALLAPSTSVDAFTLVVGYLLQAAGLGAYVLLGRRLSDRRLRRIATGSVVAYAAFIAPAVTSSSLVASLCFGYVANVLYGVFAGFYTHMLALTVPKECRGIAFGGAYAATTLLSWLLSLPAGGALSREVPAFVACCVLTIPAALLVATQQFPESRTVEPPKTPERPTLLLAGAVIVLASMVKNAGFSFPSANLNDSVSLEASRLLYGIGLVAAGLVSDRKRDYGALVCMAALVTPFFMLSLLGADAPQTLVWSVDYLLFGFFSVYRVLIAVDMSAGAGATYLACTGLLLGRVGDALGTALCLCCANEPLALVCITAVLFAATIATFFFLHQRMYAPEVEPVPDERAIFERFSARHDLSAREREVLRLVLAEKTNGQIATELFVSESTVKFHVRNLLKKTGCKNRLEVIGLYAQSL